MSELDAILFANEAFYRAFADREMSAMVDVWATEAPVSCIHPGWGLLEGLEEVLGSWEEFYPTRVHPLSTAWVLKPICRGELAT